MDEEPDGFYITEGMIKPDQSPEKDIPNTFKSPNLNRVGVSKIIEQANKLV